MKTASHREVPCAAVQNTVQVASVDDGTNVAGRSENARNSLRNGPPRRYFHATKGDQIPSEPSRDPFMPMAEAARARMPGGVRHDL